MSAVRRWDAWSCTVSVTVEGGSPDRAERVVRDLMADVDAAVSRFRDDAELVRVARHGGRLVPASALTVELVQVALQAARATDGAVDPTLGADLAALGYDADLDVVRAAPRGRAAGTRTGLGQLEALHRPSWPLRRDWRSVRVDPELRLVGVPAGVGLDLGAVAKAWTGARDVVDPGASLDHHGRRPGPPPAGPPYGPTRRQLLAHGRRVGSERGAGEHAQHGRGGPRPGGPALAAA